MRFKGSVVDNIYDNVDDDDEEEEEPGMVR